MFNCLLIMTGFLFVLSIGAFVSDYIFPHIKWLNDYMKTLPMFWDEDNDQ